MEVLRKLVGKVDRARDKFPKTLTVLEGLTNERNTWRLMGKLYNDRLVTCLRPPHELPTPVQNSERQVGVGVNVTSCFKTNFIGD